MIIMLTISTISLSIGTCLLAAGLVRHIKMTNEAFKARDEEISKLVMDVYKLKVRHGIKDKGDNK